MAVYNYYKPSSLALPFRLDNPAVNLDSRYGPYEGATVADALTEAYNAVSDLYRNIPLGLTVGIKVGDLITEYWFQGGTEKDNLVIKNSMIWENE